MITLIDRKVLNYIKSLHSTSKLERVKLDKLVGRVYNIDATRYLEQFPDNSVKLILTDEPYGQASTRLNLKERSDITTDFEWGKTPELPQEIYGDLIVSGTENRLPTSLYTPWVFEAARVLKEPGGILVNFGMAEFTGFFRDLCVHAGLTWRASGPWIKTNVAPHFRRNNLRSAHETFFIASKGVTKGYINFLEQQEMVNFIMDTICPNCNTEYPLVFSNNYQHPEWFGDVPWFISSLNSKKATKHETEKPEWLLTKFIKIFSNTDDLVIDPFCGSGSTLVVANRLGRKWSGNDLSKKWSSVSEKRMSSQIEVF